MASNHIESNTLQFSEDMEKPHILVIATGGTIASKEGELGLTPAMSGEELVSDIPGIRNVCTLDVIQLMNIDSTNMRPCQWLKIRDAIMEHYNCYDGFVILHGTDTMAYTAAALSYLIQNSKKPIILTGSQKPMGNPYTDAKINLYQSILYAADAKSCNVCIVFNGKVVSGTRGRKQRTRSFDAFESINFPYIAAIRNNIVKYNINTIQNIMTSDNGFHIKTDMCTDIAVIRLFPGMNYNIFDYLNSSCRGVIIEGFGIGGMPDNITEHIHRLTVNGICVVVTTQCLYEGVNWEIYEVGRNLTKENVINGKSMTIENLTMKLMWSLAHYKNITDIKDFMEKEL